jgi:hypothetical protein
MSLQASVQLDGEVETALAALDFADRGLAPAKPLRQIGLPKPDGLAVAPQKLQEDLLMTAV